MVYSSVKNLNINYSLISTKKPELEKSWGLFCIW